MNTATDRAHQAATALGALRDAWQLEPDTTLEQSLNRASLPARALAELPHVGDLVGDATTPAQLVKNLRARADDLATANALRAFVDQHAREYWNVDEIAATVAASTADTWKEIATGPAAKVTAELATAAHKLVDTCGRVDVDGETATRAHVGTEWVAVQDHAARLVRDYIGRRPNTDGNTRIYALVKPAEGPPPGSIYRDHNQAIQVDGLPDGGDLVRAVYAWHKLDGDPARIRAVAAGQLVGWTLDPTGDPAKIAERTVNADTWTTIRKVTPRGGSILAG